MSDLLVRLLLAPVLLFQGRWVRRVTPVLPEPPGPREGVAGAGPTLRLLILGDSAAAGVGVSTQSEALSGQLLRALGSRYRVEWKMLARTGQTTDDVLQQVRAMPDDRFDVVVTSLGVNDVTSMVEPDDWLSEQNELVCLLAERFHARHLLLSEVPPMHVFPALPQPLRWYLGQRALWLNRLLPELVRHHPECEVVHARFPLQPAFVARDGFHPAAPAYAFWADELARAISRRMAVTTVSSA